MVLAMMQTAWPMMTHINITSFHGIKKARLAYSIYWVCKTGLDRAVQLGTEYRWHGYLYPAPPLPGGCPTGSPTAGELAIQLYYPPRSLLVLASIYIITCPPHGGDFIVLKLEVFLLLRNTFITTILRRAWVCACERRDNTIYCYWLTST